ncbi:MAG: glycoside hydrolase family 3 protein [Desulfovibrio sp.]|nr:glycoside hydrolase family 3 protein [Desulfovibrio sp.]
MPLFIVYFIGATFLSLFSLCSAVYSQDSAAETPEAGYLLMFGFRGMTPDADFINFIKQGKAKNFILFDRDITTNGERNISSPDQVRRLTTSLREAAGEDCFIGVDQEGGQVRRLKPQKGFMDLPSAQRMGQGSPHETYEIAGRLGSELRGLGINLDLAPALDVDSNPFNPVIGKLGRAFNTDPAKVAEHALAFGRGLAKNGVIPVLKHFPGQGCAEKDSHLEPVDISKCWNANTDLKPYADVFAAGWPGMVMIGHLSLAELDPLLPATLSKNIVSGLLRKGLGWEGVVISDDLEMKAVTEGRSIKEVMALALDAGVDILLFGNNIAYSKKLPETVWNNLQELIAEERISAERVRESVRRIKTLHAAYRNGETKVEEPDKIDKNTAQGEK